MTPDLLARLKAQGPGYPPSCTEPVIAHPGFDCWLAGARTEEELVRRASEFAAVYWTVRNALALGGELPRPLPALLPEIALAGYIVPIARQAGWKAAHATISPPASARA